MHKSLFLMFLTSFFVFITQFTAMSQKADNYDKDWTAINKLESEGQTKTALEEVQKLYDKIKKDTKNPVQISQTIKALLFVNKYQARLEEDGLVKAIYRFQDEAEKAASPVKPILMSIVAEMYDMYLNNNLYKFQDRTAVEDYKLEDIRTWDIDKITQKCYDLHQKSLTFEETKKIDITNFEAITYNYNGDTNSVALRPTLYDFLAHRALDFFISDKYYLTKPAYNFYLNAKEDFADAKTFMARKLTAKDSISSKFQAMLLFQKMLAFHANDKDIRAFVDLDLKRLSFAKTNSILMNKDLLYLERMNALQEQYQNHPVSAEIAYQIASHYFNQGQLYQPSPTELYRWDIKKAYEICEKAAKKFPGSYGASYCTSMMNTILQKDITLNVEKVNSIDKDILSLISYKNLSKVYLKAIPVTKEQYTTFTSKYGAEQVAYLNALTGAYKWSLTLKDEGDYQTHSTEFAAPKLKNGRYILAASANEKFTYTSNGIAYNYFSVSNLSLSNRMQNGLHEYFVTDRNTGQPLQDVKVEFFTSHYNSLLRRYETVLAHTVMTDKDGYAQSKFFKESGSYYNTYHYVKLTKKDDILYLDDSYYNYETSAPIATEFTTFFLDRAIYRPGQTVYFKGLVLSRLSDGKNPQIVANASRTVTFFDANYQEVSHVEVTTNEYGTYNGSFIAPSTGMTGQMRIEDSNNNSSKYFSVEEYKRPKFEVIALPIKESFKIDDSVTVEGHAKAYAGNNIDGAKVQYRVVRQAHFPYWNWRWGWYIPFNQEQQEIAFGETTTDTEGKYKITFQAIADLSIPKDKNPEFSYTVYATVTDITGETHTTESSARVGYIALDISIYVPENVNKNDVGSFAITSQNLNYEFEAAQGEITIEQLQTPNIVHKKRYWSKPDYANWTAEDFKKKFPTYAFGEEDEMDKWAVAKQAVKANFDTKKEKNFKIENIKSWAQGRYKLVLKTKDKYGSPIELTKFFTVYDNTEKTTPLNDALFVSNTAYYNVEPDTTINVDFGSYNKDAYVLFEIEHDNKIVSKQWIQPKGRTQIPIKIEEKHRGGLHYHINSIQDGRSYTSGGTIYVPWSNKDLKIEYSTFRDKLYPGQKEEWKIKISGNKGEKVAAELLAGMYDASLDAFAANYWDFSIYSSSYRTLSLNAYNNFSNIGSTLIQENWNPYSYGQSRGYRVFNWNGFSINEWDYFAGSRNYYSRTTTADGAVSDELDAPSPSAEAEPIVKESATLGGVVNANLAAKADLGKPTSVLEQEKLEDGKLDDKPDFGDVKVRTNLNETVFFYPDLMTDAEGNVIIKFTMNEALTKWKFMLMGHTKNLEYAIETKDVVTQKDLMVMPNAPRFFRQNDEIYFTAKVSNLTEKEMKGSAQLQLFDAISMKPIDAEFGNTSATVPFEAKGGQSAPLVWKLKVPDNWTNAVTHRVVAKSGDFSDGEESALPVLSNRMLVTETQPLPIRGKSTKKFTFKSMAEASQSTTLQHHKLTLEFTQNPAWYAIQSLPYLMEYPYECTEQIFSRYYANSLASDVANAHPKIKKVFDQWRDIDTDALKSNLSKNQELKYALLEETPWVLAAQSEEAQKKNVGVLFDLNRMGNELDKARDKMADRQLGNGGFSWMPGGEDSWYITQYIVEGMGHLDKLGVKEIKEDPKMSQMVTKAVDYIDDELAIYYKELLKWAKQSKDEKAYLAEDHLDYMAIHYLYARTFFLDQKVNNPTTIEAVKYYEGQAAKYWKNKSMYMQGLLALGLHRKGVDKETPKKIVVAAKENSLNNEEMGMYWKYPSGYFWYELPIETHALMIEVFDVVAQDKQAVDDLKVWLLKAKQTTHWKTTKATAAACYSLLMTGDNWLLDDQEIEITLGGKKLDQSTIKKEAGTGYFKTTWEGKQIESNMANITVTNPNNVVAWGAMYWQYFENLDKIKHFKETPLKLNKKLFKQINTDRGPVLKPIENEKLVPGDLVKVRIELSVDRDMEYVHMKDMRASGFEPNNVISQYKYQGGLGYYESTRDASTNFFFSYLSKGTYVFEYGLTVNHKGDFSNGITTIQCMYAPEFTAHSEGVRVKIE